MQPFLKLTPENYAPRSKCISIRWRMFVIGFGFGVGVMLIAFELTR